MKHMFFHTAYFLQETKTIFKLNLLSNIFSLLSTGLMLFMLAMVASAWWVGSYVMEAIQEEAEINVYFGEGMERQDRIKLVERIQGLEGVWAARVVDEDEAYGRMAEILGQDARVLDFFDDNPFSAFIEVKIQLEKMDPVLEKLVGMTGVEHVRDNREVLDRLRRLMEVLHVLGYLALAAVGISTLVIVSHMIRQGIYHNREQINTLRLLGAPESFIAFPFLLEGLCLTLAGGLLASTLAFCALKQAYYRMAGPLPFIPLPPLESFIPGLVMLIISLSAVLGIAGGLFGLSSAKSR